jgi:hypothetical protein
MKICIVFRGPIRPNKESVIENINGLLSCFSEFDYDVLIASWFDEKDLDFVLKNIKYKYLISENVPDINYSFNKHSFSPINCVKQFYLANIAIDFVLNKKIYDFMVITRTDLNIFINPNDWLNKGFYSTIHAKKCGQPFTNDQFAITEPNIMKLAWKYDNNDYLYRMIDNCLYPEQIIDHNIDSNDILTKQISPYNWSIVR